ncbi:MAG: hypothetical protein ABI758_06140 [Candidatus Woesebacteria bacterium]
MEKTSVATIRLEGEPYVQKVTTHDGVVTVDSTGVLESLASNSKYKENLPISLGKNKQLVEILDQGKGYYFLDQALQDRRALSLNEAGSLITLVCSVLNTVLKDTLTKTLSEHPHLQMNILQAACLLKALSMKEAYVSLTADEIAGMVASTTRLDTVAHFHSDEPLFSFGGMGGDKGYTKAKRHSKLFSLSTLSAIGLSVDGKVQKHHSYPNTSKVAGQSAIEEYGARSDFETTGAMEKILNETSLLMTSCHSVRTLHSLSHQLRGETVNHAIGPLAFPTTVDTALHGFIGVNEKIHPETIVESMKRLDERGYQKFGNSVAFCGTDLHEIPTTMFDPNLYIQDNSSREHVRIDEIAPPPFASLAAFLIDGKNIGTFALYPEDFFSPKTLCTLDSNALFIPNTKESIIDANLCALSGQEHSKTLYLAMTIGLGIFLQQYAAASDAFDEDSRRVSSYYLRSATDRAVEIVRSGAAGQQLKRYVAATQAFAGSTQRVGIL